MAIGSADEVFYSPYLDLLFQNKLLGSLGVKTAPKKGLKVLFPYSQIPQKKSSL
jgi:hypothetical protein